MPATSVYFFKEKSGKVPVVDWLNELKRFDRKGFANCMAVIDDLRRFGYELRRPVADMLDDGIYELRVKHRHTQFRILYFFHGRNVAVLGHAIVKSGSAVPRQEIVRALERKRLYESDPKNHYWVEAKVDGKD